jgi:hypothetical protein
MAPKKTFQSFSSGFQRPPGRQSGFFARLEIFARKYTEAFVGCKLKLSRN